MAQYKNPSLSSSGLPQAKRARTSSMPALEPMFLPSMSSSILPPSIPPIISPMPHGMSSPTPSLPENFQANKYSTKTVPDPKEGLLASGSTKKRKNVVCRNFGSVRCSKCNKFGLTTECCNMYYYVVIRSKKVPRDVQKFVGQKAFASFREAENFRIKIAAKYKKNRHKRKRAMLLLPLESPNTSPHSPNSQSPSSLYSLLGQDQQRKVAAESLLGLDRAKARPLSPKTTGGEEAEPFSLTPPRPLDNVPDANAPSTYPEAVGTVIKPPSKTSMPFAKQAPTDTPAAKTVLNGLKSHLSKDSKARTLSSDVSRACIQILRYCHDPVQCSHRLLELQVSYNEVADLCSEILDDALARLQRQCAQARRLETIADHELCLRWRWPPPISN